MSAPGQTYYEILGVARNADKKDIRAAFARLSLKYQNEMKKGAVPGQKFFEVYDAYQFLIDDKNRHKYDKYLTWQEQTGDFRDFNPEIEYHEEGPAGGAGEPGEGPPPTLESPQPSSDSRRLGRLKAIEEPEEKEERTFIQRERTPSKTTGGGIMDRPPVRLDPFATPSSTRRTGGVAPSEPPSPPPQPLKPKAPPPPPPPASKASSFVSDDDFNFIVSDTEEEDGSRNEDQLPSGASRVFFDDDFYKEDSSGDSGFVVDEKKAAKAPEETADFDSLFENMWGSEKPKSEDMSPPPAASKAVKPLPEMKKPAAPEPPPASTKNGDKESWRKVDWDSLFEDGATEPPPMESSGKGSPGESSVGLPELVDFDSEPDWRDTTVYEESTGDHSVGYYLRGQDNPFLQKVLEEHRKSDDRKPPTPKTEAPKEEEYPSPQQILGRMRRQLQRAIQQFEAGNHDMAVTLMKKNIGYIRLMLKGTDAGGLRAELSGIGFESIERAGQESSKGLKAYSQGDREQALRSFKWGERYLTMAAEELQATSQHATKPTPQAAPAAPKPKPKEESRPGTPSRSGPPTPEPKTAVNPRAHKEYLRAMAAAKNKDYKMAVTYLTWAIKLQPNVAVYHSKLAGVLAIMGEDLRQAKLEARKAIDLEPNNADHHYYLGVVYEAAGLVSRAREAYRRAAELNPQHQPAQAALKKLPPLSR